MEENGVTQTKYIPAKEALEFFQADPSLIEALGLNPERIMEAAAMGHEVEVAAARIHARLDPEQFAKVAEVMRETPGSLNLSEAKDEARLSEDLEIVTERWRAQEAEATAFETERSRLREEAVAAIKGTIGLQTEAQRIAGSVENYVDSVMPLWVGFAKRLADSGQNQAETFKRIMVRGLDRAGLKAAARTTRKRPG